MKILVVGNRQDTGCLFDALADAGHQVVSYDCVRQAIDDCEGLHMEFDLIVLCLNEDLSEVGKVSLDFYLSIVNTPPMVAVWDGEIKAGVDTGFIDKIVPDFDIGRILSVLNDEDEEVEQNVCR